MARIFSEPFAIETQRASKRAGRAGPGASGAADASIFAGVGAAAIAAGGDAISSLSMRAVSFPPGTQTAKTLLLAAGDRLGIGLAQDNRTGRNRAGPSRPSSGVRMAPLGEAACARRAAAPDRARESPRAPAPHSAALAMPTSHRPHPRSALPDRGEQAGQEAVEPSLAAPARTANSRHDRRDVAHRITDLRLMPQPRRVS